MLYLWRKPDILELSNLGVAMNIDRFAFAGSAILLSLLLAQFHNPYWLWFTAFVGGNLLQSAFTGFCPLAKILKKWGLKLAMHLTKCDCRYKYNLKMIAIFS